MPFRFNFDPPSDPASVDAFIKAYPNLPGYHMRSTWDRLTAISTYGPLGSEEDDEPDSGSDFSGLDNPSAMRDFMTACDYCLSDCSDSSHSLGDEYCGPSRECFHVDLGGLDEGNHLGMPEDSDPPRPAPRVDILRELTVVPVPAGCQDAQLEQIREMQARLDEEAGQLVQLRQNIGQEWAGQASSGEARHLAQDVHTASPTMPGEGCPSFQWGRPEPGCSSNTTPSDAGTIHHQGAAYPGRAQESPGGCRGPTGRKLCLPKARVPPRSIAPRLPDSCGKPRSTPGARGTQRLRLRDASATSTTATTVEPTSTRRCTEATTLGMGDATTAGRIGAPRQNHTVRKLSAGPYDGRRSRPGSEPRLPSPSTRGDKAGTVARGLPAGLPAGWNGR
jgi:hypothetical protein